MESISNANLLIPFAFTVLQGLIMVLAAISILKFWKMLRLPLAGMDYGETIFAGVLIFSFLLICSGSIDSAFSSFKSYESNGQKDWLQLALVKFAQIFLLNFVFVLILTALSWLVKTAFLKIKNGSEDIGDGNIPQALIMAAVVLGLALLVRQVAAIFISDLTPHFILLN